MVKLEAGLPWTQSCPRGLVRMFNRCPCELAMWKTFGRLALCVPPQELTELRKNKLEWCDIQPTDDDIMRWTAMLVGPVSRGAR